MAALASRRVAAGGRSRFTSDGNLVHRRLDRTLEPVNKFGKLSQENREKIYNLRAVVEGTMQKMSKLEDDLQEKEAAIDREKELRKAAEERLRENLVDMYANPAVNEELRQRLPRSSSHSPQKHADRIRSPPCERQGFEGDIRDVTALHQEMNVRRNLDFEDTVGRRSRRGRRKGRRTRSVCSDTSDVESDGDYHKPSVRNKKVQSPSGRPPEETVYPVLLPHGVPYFSPTSPSATGVQPYSAVVMAPVSYLSHTVPPVTQTATPIVPTSAGPGSSPSATVPSKVTSHQTVLAQTQTDHSFSDPNDQVPADQLRPPTNIPYLGSSSAQQVTYLLEELRAAKELNKELSQKLGLCEEELEFTKRALHTKEVENDVHLTGQVSVAIEEIQQAQKDREAAILGRMRLANQERDNLYARLKLYGELSDEKEDFRLSGNEDDEISADEYLDMDIERLLSRVKSQTSPTCIERMGDAVVAKIAATHQKREEIVAEEMQTVLEERNVALAKCQKLEKQLIECERKDNPFCLLPNPERSLKSKLATALHERNLIHMKNQDLEDDLQTLRIYHSLQKDVLTTTHVNNTVDLYETQLQEKSSHVDNVQKENHILRSKLKDVAEDLEKTKLCLKESQNNNEKLMRQVRVLRRKLNGSDTQDSG